MWDTGREDKGRESPSGRAWVMTTGERVDLSKCTTLADRIVVEETSEQTRICNRKDKPLRPWGPC